MGYHAQLRLRATPPPWDITQGSAIGRTLGLTGLTGRAQRKAPQAAVGGAARKHAVVGREGGGGERRAWSGSGSGSGSESGSGPGLGSGSGSGSGLGLGQGWGWG